MRKLFTSLTAGAALIALAVPPAAAAPTRVAGPPVAQAEFTQAQFTQAQWRGGRGGDWRRYCYRGERTSDCRHRLRAQARDRDRYDRDRYHDRRDDDVGAAVALTILGTALGVQIRGTYDDRDHYHRYRNDRGWRDWCRNRYRSWDYRSGTYLGNDGYRHYCRRY